MRPQTITSHRHGNSTCYYQVALSRARVTRRQPLYHAGWQLFGGIPHTSGFLYHHSPAASIHFRGARPEHEHGRRRAPGHGPGRILFRPERPRDRDERTQRNAVPESAECVFCSSICQEAEQRQAESRCTTALRRRRGVQRTQCSRLCSLHSSPPAQRRCW